MAVTIKLNRGPCNGKVMSVEDAEYAFRVSMPQKIDFLSIDDYEPIIPIIITHEYMRSHRRLKNSTFIYEWMGAI